MKRKIFLMLLGSLIVGLAISAPFVARELKLRQHNITKIRVEKRELTSEEMKEKFPGFYSKTIPGHRYEVTMTIKRTWSRGSKVKKDTTNMYAVDLGN